MLGSLGIPELLLILVVAMLIFGAGKLPEIGRSLGRGINEFKSAVSNDGEETKELKAKPPVKGDTQGDAPSKDN
ncbi:Sec-independent protein translocase subunit TatA/TatB [Heliomicrobium modesticaldum]|uniref:Sec-independent protein translocase subunit TatA/TatB n=1 Tax=Heliomicrobium modesticaldum TaxID=35701 RepID=UPI00164FF206|nr:twin-arginine translocase TatA/TatE family subunit [Heliomicrobium modesticaldum]